MDVPRGRSVASRSWLFALAVLAAAAGSLAEPNDALPAVGAPSLTVPFFVDRKLGDGMRGSLEEAAPTAGSASLGSARVAAAASAASKTNPSRLATDPPRTTSTGRLPRRRAHDREFAGRLLRYPSRSRPAGFGVLKVDFGFAGDFLGAGNAHSVRRVHF